MFIRQLLYVGVGQVDVCAQGMNYLLQRNQHLRRGARKAIKTGVDHSSREAGDSCQQCLAPDQQMLSETKTQGSLRGYRKCPPSQTNQSRKLGRLPKSFTASLTPTHSIYHNHTQPGG